MTLRVRAKLYGFAFEFWLLDLGSNQGPTD
jgi:hypothetical protein